jgi:hypothetical protein
MARGRKQERSASPKAEQPRPDDQNANRPVRPPQPNKPLLGFAVTLFVAWLIYLSYVALS